jgi:hypothetical protein
VGEHVAARPAGQLGRGTDVVEGPGGGKQSGGRLVDIPDQAEWIAHWHNVLPSDIRF